MSKLLFKGLVVETRSTQLGLRYISILLPSGTLISGHSCCINFLRHFSTGALPVEGENPPILDPNYISGFVQADGSFFCTIAKNAKSKFGIRIRPTFTITQDLASIFVLESIRDYFNCGYISINNNTNSAEYVVSSIPSLVNIIIPHFMQYPLHSAKQYSFLMLVSIVNILKNKEHYDSQVLAQVIKMAYSMNEISNRTVQQEKALFSFLGIPYMDSCSITPELISYPLNSAFVAGLIDGDGSFCVYFKAGAKVRLGFNIAQHSNLRDLLEKVLAFFGCGTIQTEGSGVIKYRIESFEEIQNVLIPFMNDNTLHTEKSMHFKIFKEVCMLMKENSHLSKETLLKIISLAYNSNKGGKRRALSKEEYITKYIT